LQAAYRRTARCIITITAAVQVREAIALNSVLGEREAALAGLGIAELARHLATWREWTAHRWPPSVS
jgi:hypothetical protein